MAAARGGALGLAGRYRVGTESLDIRSRTELTATITVHQHTGALRTADHEAFTGGPHRPVVHRTVAAGAPSWIRRPTIGRMIETRPLLLTDDDLLRAEVIRLAAAAGVVPQVAREAGAALASWAAASVVLVGADRAAPMAAMRPPRRAGVHVLGARPLGDEVFRDALACGAETVAELPASETWLVELLTDSADGRGGTGQVVGVVGGCGGAGATSFGAALAEACARHAPTLLVDADLQGPGVDRVLGLESAPGIRWDALVQVTGRLSARSLRGSVPSRGRLGVLSWPADRPRGLPLFAVREVLSAAVRAYDVVVVDVARHPDPVGDEILARCDHVVLVSTLTVAAVAAAGRTAARIPQAARRHLVTRGNAAGVAPEEVGRVLGMPLLAAMRDQRGLDEAVDLGAGPSRSARGPLVRAARSAGAVLLGDTQESAA